VSDDIELKGTDVIKCHFEDFPMMHGSYTLNIWIGQPREYSDYVENASTLIVVPTDAFRTARTLDPLGGLAFCKTRWEIDGA
jgi:hypothetical protein